MKRLFINIKYIIQKSSKLTAMVFAFLGFVGTFAPLDDLSALLNLGNPSLAFRVLFSGLLVLAIWIFFFLVSCAYILLKRKYKVLELNSGNCVYVQYADILNFRKKHNARKYNLVIPVNRCFDTVVNDALISSNTLHGKIMKSLYSHNIFTEESLNTAIHVDLHSQQLQSETIPVNDKPQGNLERYPVGAIAKIPAEVSALNYNLFLLALSTFDRNLHAHTTNEDYMLALVRLLEYCNTFSQRFDVVMPIIGGGASQLRKSEKGILDFLVKFIKLNEELIDFDIYIVVKNSKKDSLAISETL